MKILILGNSAGGTYNFRKELLQELIKRNHEVFLSVPNDDYVERIEALGCKVIITEFYRRGMNPKQEQILYKKYCKIIKEVKPDKILTYTIKPNIYGGIAARKLGIPQLANITGLGTSIEDGGLSSKLILSLYKFGLKAAKVVFFQNQSNLDFFINKKLVRGSAVLLPGSGVNLQEFCYENYPEETGKTVLLIIGRMMKNKGTGEIIEAARIVRKTHPNVIFRFIGFADDDWQATIDSAVSEGIIEYPGNQTDVHTFIKNSHATLMASYHEGMSNVLLETASTGRPIIASDITGCKETFDEGISGIGFRIKDSGDIVRAIEEFLSLPYEKCAEMGKAGRAKVEKEFDRQIVVNKYIGEIEKEVK